MRAIEPSRLCGDYETIFIQLFLSFFLSFTLLFYPYYFYQNNNIFECL